MVTEMPEFKGLQKLYKKTFVPHWESAEFGMWETVCEPAGLTYLDPRGEAMSVIRAIAQSEFIVAESMHGAILADAFRVPWVAVSTSPRSTVSSGAIGQARSVWSISRVTCQSPPAPRRQKGVAFLGYELPAAASPRHCRGWIRSGA